MEEKNLPPGFRFHPTDEELIICYLTRKVSDFTFTSRAIVDVDLNKFEPWDLPGKASMGEKEWYFFNLRDRKYPTGLRTNRATEAGYWKTTGKDREIFQGGALVGMKKTLVFYKGRAPKGEKTSWVMHEYRLEAKLAFRTTKEEWVVCRVFKKILAMKKPQDQSTSSPYDTSLIIPNEFGDIDLPNLNSPTSLSHIPFHNYNDQTIANMNMINWPVVPNATTISSLLLGSNLSMNDLLFKALQLRRASYQPRELLSLNHDYNNTFMTSQAISQFGTDFSSNLSASSSSKVLDNFMQHDQPQEQPFNLDSIW